MTNPFAWLTSPYRWALLAILVIATTILAIKLTNQGEPLRKAVPEGILAYEFAWSAQKAESILVSWAALKETVRQQLIWDFGFLVAYPLLFSLACAMLADSPSNKMAMVGVFISWAVLAAMPLDAIENLALLRMLDTGADKLLAQLAGICAGLKFTVVYSALGYIVLQGLGTLVSRLRGV